MIRSAFALYVAQRGVDVTALRGQIGINTLYVGGAELN
jgi:hypothetical protein